MHYSLTDIPRWIANKQESNNESGCSTKTPYDEKLKSRISEYRSALLDPLIYETDYNDYSDTVDWLESDIKELRIKRNDYLRRIQKAVPECIVPE